MKFEWDEDKAAANLRKHGVSFAEASTAFADDLSLTGNDPDHSRGEHRFVTFGVSSVGRLLVSDKSSANAVDASAKDTPCLRRLAAALSSSHSNFISRFPKNERCL